MNVKKPESSDPSGPTQPGRAIDPNEHFTRIPAGPRREQPSVKPTQAPPEAPPPSLRQAVSISREMPAAQISPLPRRRRAPVGCLFPVLLALFAILVYFLAPLRTNILILGIDRAPEGTSVGRSDTNIILSINPLQPTIKMLSIPRDLWVSIPGVGENRINTAHFFAEAEEAGSGPSATLETIRLNFGLTVPYYARVRFDGLQTIIDAMGGVEIELDEVMGSYGPGVYTLNGEQALAFARDRSGTDDFFRMAQGQFLIKSVLQQMLRPSSWGRLPAIFAAGMEMVDTNLPVWQWPRMGLALLRAGSGGIDNRTLDRDMVTPWTTDQGANVLLPNWDAINPVLSEMFGQ